MGLSDMARPAEPCSESRLTYTDGTSRTVYTTDVEKAFPEGRLIVSRTDLNGIITHANDAFVEMSGYSREELIGAPHHILRHPDMPAVAFKGLWDTIEQGDEIFVIMSGRVVITVPTQAGAEPVTVLGPGDCIGEMSVIDGSTQSATATVQGGPGRVLSIAGGTFRRFLEERNHVATKIIGILSSRLRQIIRRSYAAPTRSGTTRR